MRASRVSSERGIALAVAVFALVVIGALVAGTFFAGRLEQQTGQNTMFATQAGEAAEAGLSDAINNQLNATVLASLSVDPAKDSVIVSYAGSSASHASATRDHSRCRKARDNREASSLAAEVWSEEIKTFRRETR